MVAASPEVPARRVLTMMDGLGVSVLSFIWIRYVFDGIGFGIDIAVVGSVSLSRESKSTRDKRCRRMVTILLQTRGGRGGSKDIKDYAPFLFAGHGSVGWFALFDHVESGRMRCAFDRSSL